MSWTWVLGIVLLLWVMWDLYAGTAWAHRRFSRDEEPAGYWATIALWLTVAVSCFFW